MLSNMTRILRSAVVASALVLAATAVAPVATPAAAHEVKAGALVLVHPWTRATPDGAKAAGGFLVIKNTGSEPDKLIGGTAEFAGVVQVHEMKMEGDVMKMQELKDGLEIPAGGEVALKPGSFHIMFMQLKTPLKKGDEVKGTLKFEKAGEVAVEWAVEAIDAKAPAHGEHTN
ncbi:copper chaperone PCu(A)C [Oryzibacter oryziterrae]|uniref:copper chaperone PCu(A)C n=1 Tax=Oryzibacter oryziterrae TaxID=2766474 RepID=UPI001F25A87D|nr:copper chaperone PCu(A)C [Oryzibacter oryziterrae]